VPGASNSTSNRMLTRLGLADRTRSLERVELAGDVQCIRSAHGVRNRRYCRATPHGEMTE